MTRPRHGNPIFFATRVVPAALCVLVVVLATFGARGADREAGSGPSFDCTKARSPDDRLICADAGLSAADAAVGTAYQALLAAADRKSASHKLRIEQRHWIAHRNRLCGVTDDTEVTAANRQQKTECLKAESERRAGQLAEELSSVAPPKNAPQRANSSPLPEGPQHPVAADHKGTSGPPKPDKSPTVPQNETPLDADFSSLLALLVVGYVVWWYFRHRARTRTPAGTLRHTPVTGAIPTAPPKAPTVTDAMTRTKPSAFASQAVSDDESLMSVIIPASPVRAGAVLSTTSVTAATRPFGSTVWAASSVVLLTTSVTADTPTAPPKAPVTDATTRTKTSTSAPQAVSDEPLMSAVIPASPARAGAVLSTTSVASAPGGDDDGMQRPWSNLGLGPSVSPSPWSHSLQSKDKADAAWIPKDRPVTIAGVVIRGGLIYVGAHLSRLDGQGEDGCSIDPTLEARNLSSSDHASPLPYCPAYAALDSAQRWAYLNWLAGDRSDPGAEIGLVFLYFYGLERRLIGERAEADRDDIVAEVERLRGRYGSHASFARYSERLLAAARVVAGTVTTQPPVILERRFEMPPDLKVGLGEVVAGTAVLSGERLLTWLMCDPELPWRTSAQRLTENFRALFLCRFGQAYPDGMKVTVPKRLLTLRYSAASGAFDVPLLAESDQIPDVSALRAPLENGRKIAIKCMDDLDALSRLLGKFPEKRDSLDAYILLPPELKDHEPEPVRAFRAWIAATVGEPATLVPLAEVLRHAQEEKAEKLTRRDLQALTGKLAAFGIGLEPDPAFGARVPPPDGDVALFRLGETPATAPSDGWQTAVLTLALAVTVAHADDHVAREERDLLHAHVDHVEGVSDGERRRLAAHLHWLLAHPPTLGTLRARTTGLPLDRRQQIGRLAIQVAAADGMIHPAEVTLLSKLYRALGLDPDTISGELHASVTTGAGASANGTSDASSSASLDRDLIGRTEADTDRVRVLLEEIFNKRDEASEPEPNTTVDVSPEPETDDRTDDLFPGLDAEYHPLLRALSMAERWPRSDYERLARSLGLMMPDGALEEINEWFCDRFNRFDERVLEAGDPLVVNLALLSPLQPGFLPHV